MTTDLRHCRHPLRQRGPPPRVRLRARSGRHRTPAPAARPATGCGSWAGPTTTRSRTWLAAEAAGVPDADLRRRQRRPLRGAGRAAGPGVRRLRPHQRRPPPPARRRAAVAGVRRPRATCTAAATRATTAWAASGSTPPDELARGRCPEHGTPTERVAEENWFFRLSRYQEHIEDLIASDRLAVRPEPFRREVLAFVRRGLDDISVSRSVARARGWGIEVPGDPSQVVYVWFDALDQLPQRRSASVSPAAPTTAPGGPGPTIGCTWSVRASCGSTPSTGRRSWPRPASRRRHASRCTPT